MEGIKRDISITMQLRKLQKEIKELKPKTCEELCAAKDLAFQQVGITAQELEQANQAFLAAQDAVDDAAAAEAEAGQNLSETQQSNIECTEQCEPLPAGQVCVDGCNDEFNVDAAQDALQAAEEASTQALLALTDAELADAVAKAAFDDAKIVYEEANKAAEEGECDCPDPKKSK
tara:strand:+ start:64 stop:588 length:525 start_codon:yes stop_codon:yes gene_type:complete